MLFGIQNSRTDVTTRRTRSQNRSRSLPLISGRRPSSTNRGIFALHFTFKIVVRRDFFVTVKHWRWSGFKFPYFFFYPSGWSTGILKIPKRLILPTLIDNERVTPQRTVVRSPNNGTESTAVCPQPF